VTAVEFRKFPKISRLQSPVIVTEKLDGTNACVVIVHTGMTTHVVRAQSRNRFLTPDDDNYGFARWVADNSEMLVDLLGPGYHYGEWFGQGIARNYALTRKWFALFQVDRYAEMAGNRAVDMDGIGMMLVPELLRAVTFCPNVLEQARFALSGGSKINNFPRPEGYVIFFEHNRATFKVVLDKHDEKKVRQSHSDRPAKPKWTPEMIEAARRAAAERREGAA